MDGMQVHVVYKSYHIVRAMGIIPQAEIDKLENPLPDITPNIFSYFLEGCLNHEIGTVVITLGAMNGKDARTGVMHPERIMPHQNYQMSVIDVIASNREPAEKTLAARIAQLSFEYALYNEGGIKPHQIAMTAMFDDIQRLSRGRFAPPTN